MTITIISCAYTNIIGNCCIRKIEKRLNSHSLRFRLCEGVDSKDTLSLWQFLERMSWPNNYFIPLQTWLSDITKGISDLAKKKIGLRKKGNISLKFGSGRTKPNDDEQDDKGVGDRNERRHKWVDDSSEWWGSAEHTKDS